MPVKVGQVSMCPKAIDVCLVVDQLDRLDQKCFKVIDLCLESRSSFLGFAAGLTGKPADVARSLLETPHYQQRFRCFTNHLRRPNRPSRSGRSRARGEPCVSARSWDRGWTVCLRYWFRPRRPPHPHIRLLEKRAK